MAYQTVAQPFAPSSIWNTPIGSNATYQPESGAQTNTIQNKAGVTTWIGDDATPIYQASASDPMATWSYTGRSTNADWTLGGAVTNGTFQMHTPANLQFHTGDGWAIIVSEDGQHYLETWLGLKQGTNSYHAQYVAENTVTGDGIADTPGAHEGIRAAGMSLLGGLIQKHDLDALTIDHAVAMAISTTQAGTASTPYVWPATTADGNSGSLYTGNVPLGSLFAIPKDVDLNTIGIKTAEGMALAKAYQNYGGYVTDTVGPGTIQMGYVETGATEQQIDHLRTDMQAIRDHIELVTNNSAATPGGGGSTLPAPIPAPTPTPTTPTPVTTTLGSGADQLLLKISQDAYQGDAQYTLSVDGHQVGGVQTAHASHAAGQSDLVLVRGDWGAGDHDVAVGFLNDAWGGTAAADRNLYVGGATYDGQDVGGFQHDLTSNGTAHLTFHDYLV